MMQIDYGVHSGLDIVGGVAILRMQKFLENGQIMVQEIMN
jgi:hypothetical protein